MKYKPYPEYKDSGVEWLGEVPAHWEVRRLKYVASCNDDVLYEDGDSDRLIRYVDIGNVSEGRIQGVEEFSFHNAPSRARRLVKDGDIIVSTVRTYLRAIAVIKNPPDEMVVSTGFAVIRPRKIDGNFLAQALKSDTFVDWVVAESKGISYPAINASELMALSITLPPTEEQSTIAAFLDEKTTQIDQLIENKTRFIELLQEKRAALITKAVTGKFDVRTGRPYPEYKDSGLEWLGEVPRHWKIAKVAYHYEIVLGKMLDEKRITGERLAPYLRNTDVQWDRINVVDLPAMDFSPADRVKFELRKGDLLVCEGGEIGRAALWNGELTECFYQKALHRMRPLLPEYDIPRFMFYLLWHASEQGRFADTGGKATIAHLPVEMLKQYRFPFPSREEQVAIIRFLDNQNGKLNALMEKVTESIDLLKEKRAALITAAVTGKIDVRDYNERYAA